jgi:hypothetical protein
MRRSAWLQIVAGVALATVACGGNDNGNGRAGADAPAAPAAAWLDVQPLITPAALSSAQPQLTSSARGTILSWLEHSGSTATFRFAERIAGNWSEARTIASSDNWFVSWADVPSVIRMSGGTMVATSYPATDAAIEAYDLHLSYSRDDGKTWSRPLMPHRDKTKTQHGFATLFELPSQALGLVWLDGRDQELNTTDRDGGSMGLYFASFDQQWKQTAETVVNTRVCECCQTAAAVTTDGVLTAFRDRSPREIRDIHVSRLDSGEWTPARPLHVDNWEIDACPVNGPALSARGNQVVAAWFTLKDDKSHAFASFSQDAGRTWGDAIRLDDEATLGHVDVELLEDGSAVATWVEFANQRSRFSARRVEASGARSSAVPVAGGSAGRVSGYPRMTQHGDELVFAWTESSGEGPGEGAGGQQVKVAAARIPRGTAQSATAQK